MTNLRKTELMLMAAALLGASLPVSANTLTYGCLNNSSGYEICAQSRVRDNSNGTVGTVQSLDDVYYTASIAYAGSYGEHYVYTTSIDNVTPLSSQPNPQPYPPQPVPPGPNPYPPYGGNDNRQYVCSTQSNGRHFSVPGRGYEATMQKVINLCISNGFTNQYECSSYASCQ